MYTATLNELKVNTDLQTIIDHLNKEEEKNVVQEIILMTKNEREYLAVIQNQTRKMRK